MECQWYKGKAGGPDQLSRKLALEGSKPNPPVEGNRTAIKRNHRTVHSQTLTPYALKNQFARVKEAKANFSRLESSDVRFRKRTSAPFCNCRVLASLSATLLARSPSNTFVHSPPPSLTSHLDISSQWTPSFTESEQLPFSCEPTAPVSPGSPFFDRSVSGRSVAPLPFSHHRSDRNRKGSLTLALLCVLLLGYCFCG